MLSVLLLVSLVAYLASYLIDDTNHEQQYTHHQYNDELDLGDDFKDEIEILETESNINSSLGSKLKSILTSKSLNQYVPRQPIDQSDSLESASENIINKVNVSDDYSDITNSEVVPVESSLYDNIQKNFESRYLNNFIEVYPNSDVRLAFDEMAEHLTLRLDTTYMSPSDLHLETSQQCESQLQDNDSLTEEDTNLPVFFLSINRWRISYIHSVLIYTIFFSCTRTPFRLSRVISSILHLLF